MHVSLVSGEINKLGEIKRLVSSWSPSSYGVPTSLDLEAHVHKISHPMKEGEKRQPTETTKHLHRNQAREDEELEISMDYEEITSSPPLSPPFLNRAKLK
jgi:hypothetical protein